MGISVFVAPQAMGKEFIACIIWDSGESKRLSFILLNLVLQIRFS